MVADIAMTHHVCGPRDSNETPLISAFRFRTSHQLFDQPWEQPFSGLVNRVAEVIRVQDYSHCSYMSLIVAEGAIGGKCRSGRGGRWWGCQTECSVLTDSKVPQ